MARARRTATLLAVIAAIGCGDADPCEDVDCGFGSCARDGAGVRCVCEDGYEVAGLRCEDPCVLGGDRPCDQDRDGWPGCGPMTDDSCDCDDTDPATNPGVSETSDPAQDLCGNAVDEDCDGVLLPCDEDGDGVLPCADGQQGNCDCDDHRPDVHPGAPETPAGVCDAIDNNCNGLIDEVAACLSDDLDGDGSPVGDDCNDCAASMSPLEDTTICGDRIDEDCSVGGTNDGLRLPAGSDPCPAGDADGDGFAAQGSGGSDCDDADPNRYPGAPDRCGDEIDDDCSGQLSECGTDGDGDGYDAANDCDDSDSGVHPLAIDPCDGRDDDCDGVIDEDLAEGSGCVLGNDGTWFTIDYQTDLQHCGNCRHDCNPGCVDGALCQADGCTAGVCTCADGGTCDGSDADSCCPDGCQDLTSDPSNCGRCGVQCEAPVCQVAVCLDGVCGSSHMPDGTACGGGNYCCGGQCAGECAPGSTDARGCGDCGTQTRDCGAECTWGAWSACGGEGVCAVGEMETRGCGNCGNQDRICQGDCAWGTWGVCYGQGECAPGSTREVDCNECGTQQQSCSVSCSWANSGSCDNAPGQGVGGCGAEPRCADWTCSASGSCTEVYETRGSDPDNECSGSQCCDGSGVCFAC